MRRKAEQQLICLNIEWKYWVGDSSQLIHMLWAFLINARAISDRPRVSFWEIFLIRNFPVLKTYSLCT
jgi:hypothetical protein